MPISPCIADTDCIQLVIDDDGNLTAVPIIDPDETNGLECRPTGLWAPGNQWGTGCSSAAEVLREGETGPTGDQILRTGSYNVTNPSATNSALCWRFEMSGVTQLSGTTPGSRTTVSFESKVNPAAYAGGQYVLWNNPGFTCDIAFPSMTGTVVSCPFLLDPGETQTIEWRQIFNVSVGTVTITARTAFFYVVVVVLPS